MTQINLNPEQHIAVEHTSGPLLVLAGAGSGKTRVITNRILRLLEKGFSANQILAVTFTNKAAAEMRERVAHQTSNPPLICTFHSLGVRILRESIEHLGYQKNFVIYDEEDAIKILKNCLKELNVDEKAASPKAFKHIISQAKNQLKEPVADSNSIVGQIAPQVFKLYQEKLFESSAVDFDDLLFLPVRLFKECPEVLKTYQKRWQHLLVDEYQDTNHAQYELASLLVADHHNFFVVGDPDQSIYTWRGANIQNILNFEKDWGKAKIIRLEQNYRSTCNILEAANHLIENNENRFKKNLWSNLGEGEKIYIYQAHSERDEATFIIDRLLQVKRKNQINFKDMVIFYRTNAQSRPFEDELLRRNIAYDMVGGMSFYQRREIKDVLAYLRLIENPADIVSFLRAINLPKRGLGEATLAKLISFANENHWPIFATCQKVVDNRQLLHLTPKQYEGLQDFINLIASLKKLSTQVPLHELVYQTIQQSGYLNFIKLEPDTLEDRKANIDELVGKAIEWEDLNPNVTLSDFLADLTLNTTQNEKESSDKLVLMSLHNGKGLEFHTVFIAGMEETLFPHINCIDSADGIEEERRLCYVGMTRAKRALYLTYTLNRFIWGAARGMRPSRFLREIPPQYVQKVSANSYEPSYSSKPSMVTKRPLEIPSEKSSEFNAGDVVMHYDFGVGKILKVKESSLGVTYEISFQNDGSTKTLLGKYAKLNKLK